MRPTHIRHNSVFPQVNDGADNMALACEPARQYQTAFLDQVIGRLSSKRVLPLTGSGYNASMDVTDMGFLAFANTVAVGDRWITLPSVSRLGESAVPPGGYGCQTELLPAGTGRCCAGSGHAWIAC
jgi:hypothetical protein